MLFCRGNCKTKFRTVLGKTTLRYNNGQKRCGICNVYFIYDKTKCPCCKAVLHVRPSHSKDKDKYFKKQGTKWI